jgi:hypothetical protein
MTDLAVAALLPAGALAAVGALCAAAPATARDLFLRFPRNRAAGWLLTAVAIAWSAWLLWHVPLGRFDVVKPYLGVLTPVAIGLVGWAMDDLLAARALGAVLLLAPAPILDAARWHPSPLRLAMTVLAYAMAFKGAVLVMSPHLFRAWSTRCLTRATACRICGALALGAAAALVALAVFAYR